METFISLVEGCFNDIAADKKRAEAGGYWM
jgi:hypothetical protein